MNKITCIEDFRNKYGKHAPILEEEFSDHIESDMEDFKTDPELKKRGFITMYNQERFLQFVDYINAIGEHNEMFFLISPFGTQYYAYSEFGRKNIIKTLENEAEDYQKKSEKLTDFVRSISADSEKVIIPDNYEKDCTASKTGQYPTDGESTDRPVVIANEDAECNLEMET